MIAQDRARNDVRNIDGILITLNIGALGSSSRLTYNIADRQPTWVKYLPFNSMTITNDSSSDIVFYINMDTTRATAVPSGTIKTIEGYGISSFVITNDATAITDGQVRIDFERVGMVSDNFSKALSKNVFVRALLGV